MKKRPLDVLDVTLPLMDTRLTLIGKTRVVVENHRGLLGVSDTKVRFACAKGEMAVVGMKLQLSTDGAGLLIIEGFIGAVQLEGMPGEPAPQDA